MPVFLKVSAAGTVTKPICPTAPLFVPGMQTVKHTPSVKCLAAFATHRPLQSLQWRGRSRLPRCGL